MRIIFVILLLLIKLVECQKIPKILQNIQVPKKTTSYVTKKLIRSSKKMKNKSYDLLSLLSGRRPSTNGQSLSERKNQQGTNLPNDSNQLNRRLESRGRRKPNNISIRYQQYLQIFPRPSQQEDYPKTSPRSKNSEQQTYRQKVFLDNIQKINQFNQNQNNTYIMGLNQYTDISQQQFRQMRSINNLYQRQMIYFKNSNQFSIQQTGDQQNTEQDYPKMPPSQQTNVSEIGTDNVYIDWRNITVGVNDQGKCNSCYAFSSLVALQISIKIKQSTTQGYQPSHRGPFSVQQIVSCGKRQNFTNGCIGGTAADAYYYILSNRGIGLQQNYPYTSVDGVENECNQSVIESQEYSRFVLRNVRRTQYGNCKQIINLLKYQAISVSITSAKLQFYKEGIFTTTDGKDANNFQLDHQVTVIGYRPPNLYIIKNSWGWGWGIQGHGYLGKQTGICLFGVQPLVSR